jgi:hypothetical protein
MPTGAGRKPKRQTALVAHEGGRKGVVQVLPPAPKPEELDALRTPPADLTAGEQDAWLRMAPTAIERGTLVPGTVTGFRELCTRLAQCQHLDRLKDEGDLLWGLAILRERRGWGTLLGSSMKDFKLTAFGKPETTLQPAAAVNPFLAKFG